MKMVTTRGSWAVSGTPSDAPISGSAGSMMSIDIAAIDINSAMSAMNSGNGRGNRAAVASEVWTFGGASAPTWIGSYAWLRITRSIGRELFRRR